MGYEPATDSFYYGYEPAAEFTLKNTKSKGYEPAMVNIATAI